MCEGRIILRLRAGCQGGSMADGMMAPDEVSPCARRGRARRGCGVQRFAGRDHGVGPTVPLGRADRGPVEPDRHELRVTPAEPGPRHPARGPRAGGAAPRRGQRRCSDEAERRARLVDRRQRCPAHQGRSEADRRRVRRVRPRLRRRPGRGVQPLRPADPRRRQQRAADAVRPDDARRDASAARSRRRISVAAISSTSSIP